MQEKITDNQIKMNWFQKLRQVPSNIARAKQRKNVVQSYEHIREKVLTEKSSFQVREAYKALRTNLIFSLPAEPCKKIVVTSALAAEGKSTNCINLAITFAEMNAKVLIIDCDLRRPNLARLLDVPNTPGLSHYLVGLNTKEEIVRKSSYNNLSFITSGNIPPNPVELLSSDNMEELLSELEEDFDYIFLDTPPVNVVIDTVVVSKYVHGVVMIALQNSTDKEAIRYSLNQLDFAGAKVIGFVLNGVVYGNNGAYKNVNKKKYYRYTHYGNSKKGGNYYNGYYGGSYGGYGGYGYGNYGRKSSK